MKVLFFLALAVVASIFFLALKFSFVAANSHSEVLLREPILVEMFEGESLELMFSGKVIFSAKNEKNILCLCEDENQGYYAELTPQTKVFISGKLITGMGNIKEKLKSLNKVNASMYGLYQERIILVDSQRGIYKDYWKVISIAPLHSK